MVEGGAITIPGDDAANQDTLNYAPEEVSDYPGFHIEPAQPEEKEEQLSHCLCNGVLQLIRCQTNSNMHLLLVQLFYQLTQGCLW